MLSALPSYTVKVDDSDVEVKMTGSCNRIYFLGLTALKCVLDS